MLDLSGNGIAGKRFRLRVAFLAVECRVGLTAVAVYEMSERREPGGRMPRPVRRGQRQRGGISENVEETLLR